MNEQELRDALQRMAGAPTAAEGPSPASLAKEIGKRQLRRRTAAVLAVAGAVAVAGAGVAGVAGLLTADQGKQPSTLATHSTPSGASATPPAAGDCGEQEPVTFRVTPTPAAQAATREQLAEKFTLPGETYAIQNLAASRAVATLTTSSGIPRVTLTMLRSHGLWGVTRTGACTSPGTTSTCGNSLEFQGATYLPYTFPHGVGPGAGRVFGQAVVNGCGPNPVGPVTVYQANEESSRTSLVVAMLDHPAFYSNPQTAG